jgi:hypothetical protein
MKSKDELLGDYREMTENNALQKDIVFLEVLIDIRDALAGMNKQLSKAPDPSDLLSP